MNHEETKHTFNEPKQSYDFHNKTEDEKLLENINLPYKEKLQLFTQMLRRNKMLNKAVITHNS